jgi:hypothetical protein
MTTIAQLRNYVNALCAEEEYDENEGCWIFRGGGSCCCCTDSAIKVAKYFGGRVVGYFMVNNRQASISADNYGGHNFALIDDRFVVDYWSYRVARLIKKPVLDLRIKGDRVLAKLLYGDRDSWEDVPTERG